MSSSDTFSPSTELLALRARQKATWESGDFGQVARYIETAAEEFMAHVPFPVGARVLDVACGTGNLAVIAARKGGTVCGVDIAENLITQARARARAAQLEIQFDEGDAEALPYPSASFDLTVSMYGVMFTPRPEVAAAELLRVTKPGGRIALANWTPEGFIGKMFNIFKQFLPPASVPSPLLWGDEATVRARLGGSVRQLSLVRRMARMRFPFSPVGTVEFFRKYYGPTLRAFAALDEAQQQALRSQLALLQAEHNVSADSNTTDTPAEYLEVIAVRN